MIKVFILYNLCFCTSKELKYRNNLTHSFKQSTLNSTFS